MTSHTSVSASASTVHATPDPSTWENLWWSSRPVPKRHTHLRSGEPVALALYRTVIAGINEAVKELKPGHPYKAGYFVGLDIWADTDVGYHRRAGRVLADIARRKDSPVGLIARPKGGGHRYYVIPPAPPAPYDHGFFRGRHQQPQL
ncbi:hypothetical protein [Roseateles sp. LKC17W]|uniref:DNA primase/polymerase bifunctional N-terminal domain-containing protein n=1 Tax=Pelomonas margarita TaxID=3299031 RepID=A0ABW7FFN3_9BURK